MVSSLDEPTRYDLILVAIPLAFAVGLAVGTAAGLQFRTRTALGSLLAVAPLVYGVFGAPPSGRSGRPA
ncbi:MAG: hypothetical protein ABEJ70_09280 [Halobacteriaceae archaeon]